MSTVGTSSSCNNPLQIKYEKKIQCLCQQLHEYQKQVEVTQEDLERVRARYSTSCREQEDLRRQLNQRDDTIACLEGQLEEFNYEAKEREKGNQRVVDTLQDKVCKFHEQAQQRDSALSLCRNEIKSHLATMNEFKASFSCEIQQRDTYIKQMKEDLRRVYEDLKCKSEENSQLSRSVVDHKSRVHQTCCQLKEAESKIACLQEQVQQAECLAVKDKQLTQKELEEFERKVSQSANEFCCAQNEIRQLRRCLQEKEDEFQHLQTQHTCLCQELEHEKQETATSQDRAQALENDNKEICRLLQQKVKCLKEMEQRACLKEQELEQCQCCVDELNAKIRELNTKNSDEILGDNGVDDLRMQLQKCQEKVKALEAELAETTKKLNWAVKEMECLAKEVKRLKCELDESQTELCEKSSMIGDLERTIEHAEQDMDSRMRRVDEQLQKYERDIKEKTRMIADCEEKCCRYQHSAKEKELELEQAENRLARACSEVSSLGSKVQELEEARDTLQRNCNDQRARFVELCQEFKVSRDQLQCQSVECADAKRELNCCQRELDKLRHEAEDTKMALQEKEGEVYKLTEEKSCLVGKVAHLQCRLETETTQLTQQLTDLRHKLEKEVEQLRACQLNLQDTNANLVQKLSAGQRQMAKVESCYYQKIEALKRENQLVQSKLSDKEDQLQACRDCITLKESEIMRLKFRFCSLDRCSNNQMGKEATSCGEMGGTNMLYCQADGRARRRTKSCGPASCGGQWTNSSDSRRVSIDCDS